MDSPDPSPLPGSDEQAAALAAMRRDWAEIRDEVMNWDNDQELLDCEKRVAVIRRTTLLKHHVAKHRAILLARGTDPAALEMADIEKSLAEFLESDAAVVAAEEVMWQALAKKAEAELAVAIALLERLEWMESIPQEEWDAMPDEQRKRYLSARQDLQENRDALLGELPIELRREWERRLRPE